MSDEDRIAFIKTMCETGESARYGHRPQDIAAQEFVELPAQHARRQFEDGRRTLADTKRALKFFAERSLKGQVNDGLSNGRVEKVETRFVGQWEWSVALRRADGGPAVFLEFGPTVVVENSRVPRPLVDPDFSKVFVTRQAGQDVIDRIAQTSVGLDEVLAGLRDDDVRLRDATLALIAED
ncbi:hypothetical protein ACT17Q_15690 [Cellulomonas sp. CW35]|uniref:hypothetical protein n=1 Tax=Cellulomonas sp. CW35 TaxID=3458249 RepID=UPI0040346A38